LIVAAAAATFRDPRSVSVVFAPVKLATPLLLVSVAANAALLVALSQRTPPLSHTVPASTATTAARGESGSTESLRAALASGDAAALASAGVPPEVVRELALGRSFARLAERLQAARTEPTGDTRWWRSRGGAADKREVPAQVRRELSDALTAAFGDDFGLSGSDSAATSFLAPDKRSALRRITQDYDEMIAKYSASGVQLTSDREKLALLKAERERDIAALLTPAEFAEYEMRTSNSAALLRARYGDAISSEEDFRKLYALQKAFDEKYPVPSGRITPDSLQERAQAQRQLQAAQRSAVGEETYTAMQRAADPDLRTVDSLAARLSLPPGTADRIAAERDRFAAASQKIAQDVSLALPDRQAQLQQLGREARSQLAGVLGAEAADAYAQRSPWLNMLQGGIGFSTNSAEGPMGLIPGGPAVVPVMPAGAGGPGGRTVMNLAITNDAAPEPAMLPPSGAIFFSAGVVAPPEGGQAVQVDTITIEKTPSAIPATPFSEANVARPAPPPGATPGGTLKR
jgi:hypothetical protein